MFRSCRGIFLFFCLCQIVLALFLFFNEGLVCIEPFLSFSDLNANSCQSSNLMQVVIMINSIELRDEREDFIYFDLLLTYRVSLLHSLSKFLLKNIIQPSMEFTLEPTH